MNRLNALSIAAVLVVGLAATGCCDKEKKELAALGHQYNKLQLDKSDLQKTLAECQGKNTDLMTMLAGKDADLAGAKSELASAKSELADLKARVGKPGPKPPVPPGWQETATGAKITLASDILFAAGRASLSPQGTAKLRQIAATIKTTYPDSIVRVYGFTDSDPIKKTRKLWKDNLDLSSNRAMAVVRRLRTLGIPAENLEAIGMGATHYVASNATATGKAKNRRVEIAVVK